MQDLVHVGVEVFVGVDIAKGDHYACAVTSTGAEVLARSVRNDETAAVCLGRFVWSAAENSLWWVVFRHPILTSGHHFLASPVVAGPIQGLSRSTLHAHW